MPAAPPPSSTAASPPSAELVARIARGDARAWEDLYLRYRDRMLLSIRCRLGAALRGRVESEDVLQSVFRDALTAFTGFEHRGQGSLERWLNACVLNKIRNKADWFGARKRANEAPLTDSLARVLPAPQGAELSYVDAGRYEKLERGLALLPEDMRQAIVLRRVDGLSNQEAAQALGKTPEATSKLFNRGLVRLGTALRGPTT